MIEYTDYKFLSFDARPNPGKKTKLWSVFSKFNPGVGSLGVVCFRPAWRKYVFEPSQNTVYDAGCLDEIRSFLVTQTTLWMVGLVKQKEEKV